MLCDAADVAVHQYVILTREKSKTYPIITRVPQLANAVRSIAKPVPRPNVRITNKDAQLIECVMTHVHNLGSDHDIVHYQMGYLVLHSKNLAGKVPRTVILTQSLILLCSEDFSSIDVKLSVLDSASLKDVSKVYAKDNPLFVTFVFKSGSIFASKRKWLICLQSYTSAARLIEETKRACTEFGNVDV